MVSLEDPIGTSEAARVLRISERNVLRLAESGKLPFSRASFGRLYERAEVERLAAERAAAKEAL